MEPDAEAGLAECHAQAEVEQQRGQARAQRQAHRGDRDQHDEGAERAALDMRCQMAADRLDLGQLGHAHESRQPTVSWVTM